MTLDGLLQLAIYSLAVLAVTKPLGLFMARIFCGEPTLARRILGCHLWTVRAHPLGYPDSWFGVESVPGRSERRCRSGHPPQ